jgi:hypothetical protein
MHTCLYADDAAMFIRLFDADLKILL